MSQTIVENNIIKEDPLELELEQIFNQPIDDGVKSEETKIENEIDKVFNNTETISENYIAKVEISPSENISTEPSTENETESISQNSSNSVDINVNPENTSVESNNENTLDNENTNANNEIEEEFPQLEHISKEELPTEDDIKPASQKKPKPQKEPAITISYLAKNIENKTIKTNKDFEKIIEGHWEYKKGITGRELAKATKAAKVTNGDSSVIDLEILKKNLRKVLVKVKK